LHCKFAIAAGQKIDVNPQSDDPFIFTWLNPAPGTGDALESRFAVGTLIEIVVVDSTIWLQIRKVDTWTDIDP
jgi:hypothetical protein